MRVVLVCLALPLLSGCFLDRTVNGSGPPQQEDAAIADAALADSGRGMDASSARDADTEMEDASRQPDADTPFDAGQPDAGQPDAGQPDAGQPDAGSCTPVGDRDESCDGADDDCDESIDEDADCGCALHIRNGHTYLFCADALMRQQEAASRCAELGYALVSIADMHENMWVAHTAQSVSANTAWWIGAGDGDVEGTFVWADGTAWSFTNWLAFQPDNGLGAEDCVELHSSLPGGHGPGGWNDLSCDWERFFICEAGPG